MNLPDLGQTSLHKLRRHAFDYFLNETNPANGLVADSSRPDSAASIASVGINLGPVVLMCENYWSGLPWRFMRECPHVIVGLRRADFTNGWL